MTTRQKKRGEAPRTAPRNPAATSGESSDHVPEQSAQVFEGSADSRVAIYRRDDYTKKHVFHGYVTTVEATEAKINELFGGGDYRLQLRAPDEMGREIIRQSRDFRLPGAYRPPMGHLPGIPGGPNTVATPTALAANPTEASGSSVRELMDSAMLSKVLDIMKAAPAPPPPPDNSKSMELIVTMMANQQAMTMKFMEVMVTAMSAKPVDNGIGLKELLPLLTEKTGNSDVTALIKGLKELKELSQDPPEGTGDPILDSVPRVVDILGQFAANRQGVPAPVPTPQALPPARPPLPLWAQLLQSQKRTLLSVAGRGADPAWAASAAIALMPEQYVGVLKEFIAAPEHVSLAVQVIPELGNFPVWTQKFFAAVASELSDDTDDDAVESTDVTVDGE